jgi:myo-inositol-1-phosphate synthase/intein/homing endonuclease
MGKIRCAVVGVGNCFAGLVQGVEYYRQNPGMEVIGVMHPVIAGYSIHDLDFVAAFDVDTKKVGMPLSQAVYAEPNKVKWVPKLSSMQDVVVKQSPQLDGIGYYVDQIIDTVPERDIKELKKEILSDLKEKKVEILVSYLPVGSDKATKFWAQVCIDAKIAFVNCMPSFIASEPEWAEKFRKAGVPVVGDDIKGQVGATIVHRTLARLCDDRGTKIEKTYQINVGGNSVTWDQEILLIHNGKILRTEIGKLIDEWIGLYGETRDDGKEIVDLEKTGQVIQCFTIDENFKTTPAKVSAFVRHRLNEELYEIETYEGRKIKITKDHNVFKLNRAGELEAVPICSLEAKADRIAIPRNLALHEVDLKKISLMPYLKELFAQGIDADGNIVVHNHPELRIPVEFPVSDELLQVVGLWLADGSFDREGSCNLEIACGNEEDCMGLINDFTSAYNINYEVRGEKQVAVRIMSKTIAKIFKLALGLNGNSYTKRFPGWVFGLSDRQIAMVVKGYVSGDGTVTGNQIRWTTASPKLAEDMMALFLRIGINSTMFREDYTDKNLKGSYKTALEYITHGIISSKEDVGRFIEKVGFIQSEKNERAARAYTKLARENMNAIPKFDLLNKWGIRSTGWPTLPSLRAHIVLSQLNKVKDAKDAEKLRNICDGDTHFVRIKSIKRIKAEQQYVYDLNVPVYQRFICSNILVHNTDFINMKEQERLVSKRISKTESVQSQLRQRLPDDQIYVGPSDFIPFLSNTKLMFMRIEGRMWANVPYNMEVRLEVDDKANSAGIVIDAVRLAKIALERKLAGPIVPASAYLMKHPPKQMSDPEARAELEKYIKG